MSCQVATLTSFLLVRTERCQESSNDASSVGICSEEILLADDVKNENFDVSEEQSEEEMKEYLLKDSVAKFQFDYNRNTCFANDVPEISVKDTIDSKSISIAPGEGKVPK